MRTARLAFSCAMTMAALAPGPIWSEPVGPAESHGFVSSIDSDALALSDALTEAYRARNWPRVRALVSSSYIGLASGETWDLSRLEQEFPRIKLQSLVRRSASVVHLRPDLIVISEDVDLQETYSGRNISGRYQMTTVWEKEAQGWRLRLEQEVAGRCAP